MKREFKMRKLLLAANLSICLILNILSVSAANNVIMIYSGGTDVTLHESHKPRITPLRAVTTHKPVDWDTGLRDAGYLSTHHITTEVEIEAFTDYGGWFSQGNAREAELSSWMRCDDLFDTSITSHVKTYIERYSRDLTIAELNKIKENLNPGRGKVKANTLAPENTFSFASLDETRICKFHLSATRNNTTTPHWSCNRHKASMTANLNIDTYTFVEK